MAKTEDYSAQNWEDDMKSVIRRTYISAELNKGKTLEEIKENVRNSEKEHDSTNIIDKLRHAETIEPRIEKLCVFLLKELKFKYPYVKGIVVMGSGSQGGGLVRSLVNTDEDDLDWGVIVTQDKAENIETLETEINQMRQQADKYMKTHSRIFGFTNKLESCFLFNPEQYFEPELDSRLAQAYLAGAPEALVFYLQPTIPNELGEKNVALIKAELEKLKELSEEDYVSISSALIREWHTIHNLQGKHFRDFSTDTQTRKKILRIAMNSRKYMDEDFVKKISSQS